MKKIVIIAVTLFLFCSVLALTAQEQQLFVKSVPIQKVYPHYDGYRIVYMKNTLELGITYIPMDWFYGEGAATKAEVLYGNDPSYPYISIFWQDGEFHHLRLYLIESKNHPSWGVIDYPQRIARRFDVEEFTMDF
jgi:hypothetical protein